MKALYVWERSYPHIISLLLTGILMKISFNPVNSTGIDSLVDGIVTLDSIIIGFIGAIIPVILSMKNESKLVKYVFDKDNNGLFKKYLSETIGYGLTNVCVSLLNYVRDIITNKYILNLLSIMFIYTFLLFILSTYRSMTCMLKLIFSNDNEIQNEVTYALDEQEKDVLWKKKGK